MHDWGPHGLSFEKLREPADVINKNNFRSIKQKLFAIHSAQGSRLAQEEVMNYLYTYFLALSLLHVINGSEDELSGSPKSSQGQCE